MSNRIVSNASHVCTYAPVEPLEHGNEPLEHGNELISAHAGESSRRPRGRPRRSNNMPKPPTIINYGSGNAPQTKADNIVDDARRSVASASRAAMGP